MSTLTLWQNGHTRELNFQKTPLLREVLAEAGIPLDHPCAGRGICGKCAVEITGEISPPNEAERRAGHRLACQIMLLGDARVWLPESGADRVEISGAAVYAENPMEGQWGAAVDIGTTTLALKLFNLKSGAMLAARGEINPQRSVAADVMGRIGAALEGQGPHLQEMILRAVEAVLKQACADAHLPPESVSVLVITGNTTMLYLLTGRNPECLSHAPFHADTRFDFYSELLGKTVYYPPCMNAFVGADITCAVLASRMYAHPQTALLCDIGTNGEIALWKDGKLFVTSTAAGPAFEGAGISCGCGSVPGAIDRVWTENGEIHCHTLGETPAVGICGSGLIDAVAAFLETGVIDETGAVTADSPTASVSSLSLRDGIHLLPQDIRAVQLAKAAIRAGIQTLLETAGLSENDIVVLYIAGGFGSHLNVSSAAAIGLIPPGLENRVQILGNAALSGAAELLLNQNQLETVRSLAAGSVHLNLGGNPRFNENYMDALLFDEP